MTKASPVIAGRYQIEGLIATGGMAEIFLATELGPKGPLRKVAVKKILPQFACQSRFREMFLDESEIAARCEHPNLIRVYAVLEEMEELYLVEEYIDGWDVARVIDRLRQLGQKMPEEYAASVALNVARGLEYIHNLKGEDGKPLGIVHRDINHSNVMLTRTGEVKILDFGIAKHAGRDFTKTDELRGKLGYLAPEQIAQKNIGPHTDLYCLGLVLYELLTLQRAIRGETSSEILAFAKEPNITPVKELREDISDELKKILDKLLGADVDRRYQEAVELEDDMFDYFTKHRQSSSKELGKFVESLDIEQEIRPWRETAIFSGGQVSRFGVPPHAPSAYKKIVVKEKFKRALPFIASAVVFVLIVVSLVVLYVGKLKSVKVTESPKAAVPNSIRLASSGELMFCMVDNSVVLILPFSEQALDYKAVRTKALKFLCPRYAGSQYVVKTLRKTPVKPAPYLVLVRTRVGENYQALVVDGQKRIASELLPIGWHLVWSLDSSGKVAQLMKPYNP